MSTEADLASLYEAKALAELGDAEALAGVGEGGWSGDPLGVVALVVAAPLPSEAGDAVDKATAALGVEPTTAFSIVSRPQASKPKQLMARLRMALEAVDAPWVLALDTQAAEDVAVAFGVAPLVPGVAVRAGGRVLGSVGDFAGSLADPKAKARVWAAMRSIAAGAGLQTQAKRP